MLRCLAISLLCLGAAIAAETIAGIPKGTTHVFWKSIHAGAVKAERELQAAGKDIKIIWQGPLKEDDRGQQIQLVENFINQGVKGIVLAPLDDRALVAPVEAAGEAGIPTVIIDSNVQTDKRVSFVATNNKAGGALGAKRLGEVLGGKGTVLLLRYQEGSASTNEREEGFIEGLKAFPGITLIDPKQYAGATRDSAFRAANNLLLTHGNKIQAVFTPNESSTAGMTLALQDQELADGAIKHIGFDASPDLITALNAGHIQGLVVQDPFQMGYLGVKNLAAHLAGEKVAAQVDTPLGLVTPENINEPAVKALIEPPLDEFLK